MAKKHYLPKSDEGKGVWLNNFSEKLPNHAAALGISADTLTSVQNDAKMFNYMVNLVNAFKNGQGERVGYKDILKFGPEGTVLGPVPVFNNVPPPANVQSGIFIRIRRLVQNIKSNNSYNESIGSDLGIIGSETDEVIMEMKPVLKVRMAAGKPEIVWKKGKADSIDIYVDRGDGKSFVYLANDSNPNFRDNSEIPAGAEISEWKYKAIYRIRDEQVGQFSDVASAVVKKEVA